MQTLDQMRENLAIIATANRSILDAIDSEQRAMTADELKEINENTAQYDLLLADISVREVVELQNATNATPQDRRVPALRNNATQNPAPAPNGGNRVFPQAKKPVDSKGGFLNLGEFLQSVKTAQVQPGHESANRLRQAASTTDTYGNETVPADGGYSLPPDFRATIMEKIGAESSLLSMTDQLTTSSNSITMPIDESAPWGTDGMQARWESEGAQKLESKISLDTSTVKLNKIAAVVPVTDELLEDVPALDSYIKRRLPEKIDFKVTDRILNGTGVGEPLGIMQGTDLIKVAPGLTPAGQIQFPSIAEMYSRMYAPSRSRAVWIVNPELEYKLLLMAFMSATAAANPASPVPVYLPAGSIAGSPFGTLLGRPIIPTVAAAAAGVKGDIIFADMSAYLTLIKGGGVRQDVSIHCYFVQDVTAFRFVLRIGGKPWWKGVITPPHGTFTQAHFVALNDR